MTRGKGLAVHSRKCPNVQYLDHNDERKIDLAWAPAAAIDEPVAAIDEALSATDEPAATIDEKDANWHVKLADRIALLRARYTSPRSRWRKRKYF